MAFLLLKKKMILLIQLGVWVLFSCQVEIGRFHSLRGEVLHQEFLTGNLNQFDYPQKEPLDTDMAKDYLLHVLKAGSAEDRIKILSAIKTKFILHNKQLSIKT